MLARDPVSDRVPHRPPTSEAASPTLGDGGRAGAATAEPRPKTGAPLSPTPTCVRERAARLLGVPEEEVTAEMLEMYAPPRRGPSPRWRTPELGWSGRYCAPRPSVPSLGLLRAREGPHGGPPPG